MFLPRSEFQPLDRIVTQQVRAATDYRNIRIYIVQLVIPRDIELLIVFRQLAVRQDVKEETTLVTSPRDSAAAASSPSP